MNIDLTMLNSNNVDTIEIDRVLDIPKKYFENSGVKELNGIKVLGKIYRDLDDVIKTDIDVSGKMLIEDAISLEDVYYNFSTKIEENLLENQENLPNLLDLCELLWENIVLEVPTRYTEVEDISAYHGSGWSLIEEDEDENPNNPFKELLNKMDKEWYNET